MYAQVVVLTYQSPEIDSYTYEVPQNLESKIQIGQLVSVPFGKRNPAGLVLSTSPEIRNSKFEIRNLKEISNIIYHYPILLPYQLELLKWMSSYYLAPMVNCSEAMLPKLPNAKRLTTNAKSFNSVKRSALSVQQTLVLVPSIDRIPETLANFPQAKNYVVYHNQLKVSEKFAAWQKILSGQCDFIFGSRLAIFAPCPNLKKIIIEDEHDGAYKDERSPYFDTLTVAEKIAELTRAKIEIIDSCPRITTYYLFRHSREGNDSRIRFWTSQNDKVTVQTKTIDMAIEKAYGSFSPISQTLEEILKRATAKKLSILLFLNKKSESGSVYCKSCKTQTVVPSQIDTCQSCGSADIYFNSVNVSSLAKDVKKVLPGVHINLIDAKTFNFHFPKGNEALSTFNSVDIATAAVFYKLSPKKYDVAVHVKTDSVLALADYTSAEKLYAQIINLKKLAKKLVVLQTYNPDHQVIKNAVKSDYQKFYLEEISQRKTFSYPPFVLLIKITVSGKNAQEKSEKLAEDLKLSTLILGPYQSAGRQNIILKLPVPNYSLMTRTKILEELRTLLPREKDVKIIVEPNTLI